MNPRQMIAKAADKLLGKKRGRAVTLYPDDRFLVSYPRSGNTWMRFLIANLISPTSDVTIANLDQAIPGIYKVNDRELKKYPRPRILKSHEYYHPEYRSVIYLIRDPRDTAISNYYYLQKIRKLSESVELEEYIDYFISGSGYRYGCWGEHVGGWLGARSGNAGFIVVRYEDLRDQPVIELKRVAQFLGLCTEAECLVQAVQRSDVSKMRASEIENRRSWKAMRESREDLFFVRQGASGGWKTILSGAVVGKIETAWKNPMKMAGYELSMV